MSLLAFILGLSLGIGIYLWNRHQLNQQLRRLLNSLSIYDANIPSLSTLSLVRRALLELNQQKQQLTKQIETWYRLIELAPIGYLHLDGENQLLWCNQQARKLLQIDRWQPNQLRLRLELAR